MPRLGLPPALLLDETARRGKWNPLSLEELRDGLRQERRDRPRRDFVFPLRDVGVRFDDDGGVWLRPGRGPHRRRWECPASSSATEQLLARIGLPSLYANLEDLVAAGRADLATAQANALLQMRAGDRVVRLRARRREVGDHRPTIEAVVGDRYAPYDDLQLVTDLLASLRRSKKLPGVISAFRSTAGLRLRLTTDGQPAEVGRPIRMLEARNSEVGRGSAMVCPGIFTLVCTNGMHHWSREEVFRWSHLRADPARIAAEIGDAVGRAWEQADTVYERWRRAADVVLPVEEPEAAERWLRELARRLRLGHALSRRAVSDVVGTLDDPTTTRPASGRWSLATVADAMTLRAQDEGFAQRFEFERAAGRLLEGALELERRGALPEA